MNLLLKIALIGLGLILILLVGVSMKLLVVFSLRRFNRTRDTHDLKPRVDKLASNYIKKHRMGPWPSAFYRKTRGTFKAMNECYPLRYP